MAKKAKEKNFLDENLSEEKEKSLFQKILNIVLWIVLFAWMGLCIIDYIVVQSKNDPVFCLKKEVNQYDDGTVKSCLGLGYKVYQYNRDSYSGIEFGPFWIKDRSAK